MHARKHSTAQHKINIIFRRRYESMNLLKIYAHIRNTHADGIGAKWFGLRKPPLWHCTRSRWLQWKWLLLQFSTCRKIVQRCAHHAMSLCRIRFTWWRNIHRVNEWNDDIRRRRCRRDKWSTHIVIVADWVCLCRSAFLWNVCALTEANPTTHATHQRNWLMIACAAYCLPKRKTKRMKNQKQRCQMEIHFIFSLAASGKNTHKL